MQTELVPQNLTETDPERRKHPRYRLGAPLSIHTTDGLPIHGITIEISASGISAVIAGQLKVNDIVELKPFFAGKVTARVRRNIGRVYGFEFLSLTPEQSRRIEEACKTLPRHKGTVVTGLL